MDGRIRARVEGPDYIVQSTPATSTLLTVRGETVFETARLRVRTAREADAGLYLRIWTDPRIMRFVGFPRGLKITLDEIRDQIRRAGDSEFDCRLVVLLKESGEPIGEARLHRPDGKRVAKTDVKLLPGAWGHRYGTEVKAGLVQYLFEHTDCRAVEGTPNRENIASIRMQEAAGGVRVGDGVFEFPEELRDWTCPVPHFVYHVRRADWRRRFRGPE